MCLVYLANISKIWTIRRVCLIRPATMNYSQIQNQHIHEILCFSCWKCIFMNKWSRSNSFCVHAMHAYRVHFQMSPSIQIHFLVKDLVSAQLCKLVKFSKACICWNKSCKTKRSTKSLEYIYTGHLGKKHL